MLVQSGSVVLNAVLAPVLIAGWGTGQPLGAFGAGLATAIAAAVSFAASLWLFGRVQTLIHAPMRPTAPDRAVILRIIGIGLPSAIEFLLMFVTMAVIYSLIRQFGAEAQAGFGVGSRVMQAVFLPAMAVSFAVAPVAGQNFGARKPDRVRATFRAAALIATAGMALFALLAHVAPAALIGVFSNDPAVIAVGDEYLRISSWNFVASGLIFVTASMFQAMGNTIPSLVTSFTRILLVAVPAFLLSRMPGFEIRWIWYLSVVAVALQMSLNLLVLRREFRVRLGFAPAEA